MDHILTLLVWRVEALGKDLRFLTHVYATRVAGEERSNLGAMNFDAVIIFAPSSASSHRWYLDRDFQHCVTGILYNQGWILYDPLRERLATTRLGSVDLADLAETNARLNRIVIVGNRLKNRHPCTRLRKGCVSVAKRLIGINSVFPLSPRQLYLYCIRKLNFVVPA